MSSPRRRGPIIPTSPFIEILAPPRGHSVWVPAFAGTTVGRPVTPLPLRGRRGRGEISAPARGKELAVLVVDVRLGTGELAARADDLALGGEVARHGGGVIVDAQVDGRQRTAELLDHRPVGGEID